MAKLTRRRPTAVIPIRRITARRSTTIAARSVVVRKLSMVKWVVRVVVVLLVAVVL